MRAPNSFVCVRCVLDQNDLHRQGRGYLGKLRSNFVGTEFQVFDNGVNPKDTDPDEAAYASKCCYP